MAAPQVQGVVVKAQLLNYMAKNLLMVMIRNPKLGQVKTRLAKDIGDQQALKAYDIMTRHTADVVKKVKVDKMVFYSESVVKEDVWSDQNILKAKQCTGDLGKRMNGAFEQAFTLGYQHVIIIGSDVYSLKTKHLNLAFKSLISHDAVIGPAQDGGYYLLGLKTKMPYLFSNKTWGESTVLKETLHDLKNRSVVQLEVLNDIDTLDDLKQEPKLLKQLIPDGKIH